MKKESLNLIVSIITALIIFLHVTIFTGSSQNVLKEQLYYEIQQTAQEKAGEIQTAINYAYNSIKLISHIISSNMNSYVVENPDKALSDYSERSPFLNLGYIDYDGIKYLNDGSEFTNAKNNVCYLKGIRGFSGINVNYNLADNGEVFIEFYTPLYYQRKIVGVIVGVLGGNTSLRPLLDAYFYDQKVIGIVFDENYNVISSTDSRIEPGLVLKEFSSNQMVSDIISHVSDLNSDAFSYTDNNREGLCCVVKTNDSQWNVGLIILPKDYERKLNQFRNRFINIFIFCFAILLAYLFFQIYMNRKSSKEIEESQKNIIDSLGIAYENVSVINLENNSIIFYRMSAENAEKYKNGHLSGNYNKIIRNYYENEVFEDDKTLFSKVLTIENLFDVIKNKNDYSFIYRVVRNEEIHYFQAQFLKAAENSKQLVLAIKDVDEIMEKELADKRRLNEMLEAQSTQLSILTSMSEIYLTTHLIDLKNNILVEINASEEVRRLTETAEGALEQVKAVMIGVIVPEYQETALAFSNLETVAKRMKDKKIISEELLGRYHGWVRTSFISVESDADGIPNKVIFVTQIIDQEKRRVENLINVANRDELTGLYNRHAYELALKELKVNPPADNFVYVSMDVNGLKVTNDNLGHAAGDELICGAADCIQKAFGPYGEVFRTGGDEFQAFIYIDLEKLNEVKDDFQRIVESWSGTLVDELRISAGYVAKKDSGYASIIDIAKQADQNMYKAKSLYYRAKGIDRRGQQLAYEVLCQSYTKVLKVDLTKDEFSVIQMNNNEKIEKLGYSEKISEWLKNFAISGQVHRDDKKNYLKATDIDALRKYFADGNVLFSIRYKRKINNKFNKVLMEMIPSKEYTDENQIVFLYVKNIDKNGAC